MGKGLKSIQDMLKCLWLMLEDKDKLLIGKTINLI